MRIALSKASGSQKYENYERWLRAADDGVNVLDCSVMSVSEAVLALEDCDGLLLTGGADIEPDRYGQPEKRPLCHDVDPQRDELELALIHAAVALKMPILGICRGAQILNVAFGGTLIADLPTVTGLDVEHGQVDGQDGVHAVDVEPGSLIKRICRVLEGNVNTAHHQAVERLAGVFAPSAIALDGTIEAFEAADASSGGRPFILAVQWHPERMDWDNPLSMPIAVHFLNEAHAYGTLMKGE